MYPTVSPRSRSPRSRFFRAALVMLLVVAVAGGTAGPAVAACHIAAFSLPAPEVGEAPAGGSTTVDLTVVLQGRQPSCAGTVDYATADQTATAGEDYESASGTLTFASGDDREETISVTILSDDVAEGAEDFQIDLTNPTDGISGTGDPIVVTIAADEPAVSSPAGTTVDAEPTAEGADPATSQEEEGGNPLLPVLLGLVIIGLAAAFILSRRRSG